MEKAHPVHTWGSVAPRNRLPACPSTVLTFMPGKVAAQNDEQAQHGEYHHSHDAADHGVVHCPDGALLPGSGICRNHKRSWHVALVRRHQRPWRRLPRGSEGAVSEWPSQREQSRWIKGDRGNTLTWLAAQSICSPHQESQPKRLREHESTCTTSSGDRRGRRESTWGLSSATDY